MWLRVDHVYVWTYRYMMYTHAPELNNYREKGKKLGLNNHTIPKDESHTHQYALKLLTISLEHAVS